MTQNLNWLPNVSNVGILRALRKPDPHWTKAGASLNNNNSNNNSGNAGGNNSSSAGAQARLDNHDRDSRLKDRSQPIVTKIEALKMREAIQSMKDKGKGPLLRPDGKEPNVVSDSNKPDDQNGDLQIFF
eukprot:jgi/Psemu1/10671/gm1.10671_g